MKLIRTSLKNIIAFSALGLLAILSNSIFVEYAQQSFDVTVNNDGFVTACSISDFIVTAYDYENIEILEQIPRITIVGISGNPLTDWVFGSKGITAATREPTFVIGSTMLSKFKVASVKNEKS